MLRFHPLTFHLNGEKHATLVPPPRREETPAREEKTHFCFFEAATLISVEPKQVLSDDLFFSFKNHTKKPPARSLVVRRSEVGAVIMRAGRDSQCRGIKT